MKRFRLSTLLLLVVIAALCLALVMAARRESEYQARLAKSWPLFLKQQRHHAAMKKYYERVDKYSRKPVKTKGGTLDHEQRFGQGVNG